MEKVRDGREIAAVFFDAGETLIHPHPSFVRFFQQICEGHGIKPKEEDIARIADDLMREVEERQERGYSFTATEEGSREFWLRFYRLMLEGLGSGVDGGLLAEDLFRAFSDPSNYRLYPDVLPALEELRSEGYLLGVISNFEPWLVGLLNTLGVRHYFQALIVSGLVGAEKPQKAIFLNALEAAGVEADRAMHVGDSLRADVEGAQRVGMVPVLLDRNDRHPNPPCLRLRDLRDLPALLREEAT